MEDIHIGTWRIVVDNAALNALFPDGQMPQGPHDFTFEVVFRQYQMYILDLNNPDQIVEYNISQAPDQMSFYFQIYPYAANGSCQPHSYQIDFNHECAPVCLSGPFWEPADQQQPFNALPADFQPLDHPTDIVAPPNKWIIQSDAALDRLFTVTDADHPIPAPHAFSGPRNSRNWIAAELLLLVYEERRGPFQAGIRPRGFPMGRWCKFRLQRWGFTRSKTACEVILSHMRTRDWMDRLLPLAVDLVSSGRDLRGLALLSMVPAVNARHPSADQAIVCQ